MRFDSIVAWCKNDLILYHVKWIHLMGIILHLCKILDYFYTTELWNRIASMASLGRIILLKESRNMCPEIDGLSVKDINLKQAILHFRWLSRTSLSRFS